MFSQLNTFEEEEIEKVQRGQICYYAFPDVGKYVQKGVRPCLVVGNDKQNMHSDIVVIVPITSSKTKKPLPTHVEIPEGYGVYGTIVCEQIMTASLSKLRPMHQYLDEETMKKVDIALGVELGLPQEENRNTSELLALKREKEILKYKLEQYRYLLDALTTLNAFEEVDRIHPNETFLDKLEEHIQELRR